MHSLQRFPHSLSIKFWFKTFFVMCAYMGVHVCMSVCIWDSSCERKRGTFLSESSLLSFTWWTMSSPIYFAPNDMTSFFMAWRRLSYVSAQRLCSPTTLRLHCPSMGWVGWSESCLPCPGRDQSHLPVSLARCPEARQGFSEQHLYFWELIFHI